VQGTRFGIIAFVAASLALTLPAQSRLHETLANATRPSPDDRWKVNWRCRRAGRASLLFLANQAGKFFSAIHVSPAISRRSGIAILQNVSCLMLPIMRTRFFGSFGFEISRRHQQKTVEKLDYEAISTEIERAKPETRRREPHMTRSDVEKMTWDSASDLRLHITYNNISVVARVETSTLNQPRITVLS